jgi:HemY protein
MFVGKTMIRVLVFLVILALVASGIGWIADQPGNITVTWSGPPVETSIGVAIGIVFLAAVLLNIAWTIIRFVFRLPSLMSIAAKARRRAKGFAALSRGMIAAGAGDARSARKAAAEAKKHLHDEPLALLLSAQAAQLSGDRARAENIFGQMTERDDTRLLGLRGLHVEAHRRGDYDAAHHFAHEAHAIAPLPWSAKAVLDHRTAHGRWEDALAALDSHIEAKLVDKKTGERQRAVLATAIALDHAARTPDEALKLVQGALRSAPDLVPALALCARLLARKGDLRKAAKMIERVWPRTAHPELAAVYLDLRPGDSSLDRLAKAQNLMRLAPREPESRLAVARAALVARQFDTARQAMAPLVTEAEQPTAGMCLLMAELENAEHGDKGQVRQWMARASRAPRDATWIADGVASATWQPASPVTGRLDAFVWQSPPERPAPEIAHDARPDWTLEWVQGRELGHEIAPPAPETVVAGEPPDADESEAMHEARVAAAPVAVAPVTAPEPSMEPSHLVEKPNGKSELGKSEAAKSDVGKSGPGKAAAEAAVVHRPEPPQKVVFPLPAAPDDPGLDEEAAQGTQEKKRVGFF